MDFLKTVIPKKEDRPIVVIGIMMIVGFYGVFFVYPIVKGFIGSFHVWNPVEDVFQFKGLGNYVRMTNDKVLLKALRNTAIFTLCVVLVRTALALTIALGINSVKRLRTFIRAAFFVPVIVSLAAASLVWGWMYHPRHGIINAAIALFGIDTGSLSWITSSKTALMAIIIAFIWKTIGIPIVIYLAGLSNIPKSFVEAARVDGCTAFELFRYIQFPMLMPATIFALVTGTIYSFQVFVPMFIMTDGGPSYATTSIVQVIYLAAFRQWRFGYAAAITQVLFVIIMVTALGQLYLLKKGERF